MNRKEKMAIICASVIILLISNVIASNYIVKKEAGPGYVEETKVEEPIVGTKIISVASDSNIYIHDGIAYVKGEDKGRFSLSGYCACTKCGTGTGITASGKPVREEHTIASDWKVLPKGTVIILENAVGKDGQVYDGVYVVEDRGGGVKNNHIDIYRPTHELASLVTHYGRAYGNVFIAEEYKPATNSEIEKNKEE
ncbi:MAG: 3D domain-containing protein [Lachnospiraceae bacterium]|nr:3D domain-containing protein [Lachnospiraceae bacterium]